MNAPQRKEIVDRSTKIYIFNPFALQSATSSKLYGPLLAQKPISASDFSLKTACKYFFYQKYPSMEQI